MFTSRISQGRSPLRRAPSRTMRSASTRAGRTTSASCCSCICFLSHASFRFFFSSRRRHTRSLRDWSSDVCSSDLILIVDDEAGVRASLAGVLRDEGYQVDAVDSGEACLDQVTRKPYDVVLLDVWLPRSEERRVGKERRMRCATREFVSE